MASTWVAASCFFVLTLLTLSSTYFFRAMAGRTSRSTATSASNTFLRRLSPFTRLTGARSAYGKMGVAGTGAGYCC